MRSAAIIVCCHRVMWGHSALTEMFPTRVPVSGHEFHVMLPVLLVEETAGKPLRTG